MASGIPSRRRQIDTTSGSVSVAEAEIGPLGPGPVDEQGHGVRRSRRREPRLRPGRERQRRHSVDGLAVDAERLAAGRHQMDVGAAAQDGVGDLGAGADQVLAVVQDDQDVLGGEGVEERLEGGTPRLAHCPQRLGDSRSLPRRGS